MHPFVLDVQGMSWGRAGVSWYGLGFTLALALLWFRLLRVLPKELGLPAHRWRRIGSENWVLGLVLCTLAGARGLTLWMLGRPGRLAQWLGASEGMSFFGGVAGASAYWALSWLWLQAPGLEASDAALSVLPLGIGWVRLASYAKGEILGKLTSLPCGVLDAQGRRRHPVMLYEACLEGPLLAWLTQRGFAWIRPSSEPRGLKSARFFFFYGLIRCGVECFRDEPLSHPWGGGWSLWQLCSMAFAGVGWWVRYPILKSFKKRGGLHEKLLPLDATSQREWK